jgi:DNA-binding Lrp family transcriptional regulator
MARIKRQDLDSTDIKIINSLQRDAKKSIQAISEEVGLSNTPTWNRINLLKEKGCILGSRTIIDYSKIGYNINVMVTCTVPPECADKFHRLVMDSLFSINISQVVLGKYEVTVFSKFLCHFIAKSKEQLFEELDRLKSELKLPIMFDFTFLHSESPKSIMLEKII